MSRVFCRGMISFDACIASARPDSPDLYQFHNDSRPRRLQLSTTCDYHPEFLQFFRHESR
jgi:hypothetical protein